VPRLTRLAVLVAAALVAVGAASARADDVPGSFVGHGVTFSYPTAWLHVPASFEKQVGAPLWMESFGPIPVPNGDPSQPAQTGPLPDLVTVASYRLRISVTKKTLPRLRPAIQALASSLALEAGGKLLGPAQRTRVGKFPAYRMDATATLQDATVVQSRLVFAFNRRTEYFLNCQHVQDGPLSDEIESGCDQVMQSFRLSR
jgi:hypothetical protein